MFRASALSVLVQKLLEVLSLLDLVLHCLRLELNILNLSHLLLLGLELLVEAVEPLVNGRIATLLSELGLNDHARRLIDLRVHETFILLRGLLTLLLELLVNTAHEVVLVL